MKSGFLTIMIVLLLAASPPAEADPIVFENLYDDNVSVVGPAWCSGCGTMWRVWDTFTLATDTEITQIDARLYLSNTQAVHYSIWTPDRSGILFARVFTYSELSVDSFGGSIESDVTASIAGLSLAAGDYALSIWDMATAGSYFAWYSTTSRHVARNSTPGSGYQSLFHDGGGRLGGASGEEMAFRVHGITAVPEPGTIALLALGLLGILLTCRSRALCAKVR